MGDLGKPATPTGTPTSPTRASDCQPGPSRQPNPPPRRDYPPPLKHVGRWTPRSEARLTDPGPGQTGYAGLFRIVPEDVDFDDPDDYVNPCTGEVVAQEWAPFDYYKYMEYHRYKCLLHRFLPIKERTIRNTIPPQPGLPRDAPLDELDDEQQQRLKVDYQRRYGPTNFDDPVVQKQLKTMGEALLEMESEGPDEAAQFLQEMIEEDVDHPNIAICKRELLDKMKQKFTPEERQAFMNPSFLKSAGEWFLIPRPEPFQIRQNVLKSAEGDEEDLKNLHVYDPKFEFSLEPPYLNFYSPDGISPKGPNPNIPKMITVRILELLNTYPNGVAVAHFCEVYQKKHGPFPGIPPYGKLEDVLKRCYPDEIYTARRAMNLPAILFPACLNGITCSPEIIVKRVWHAVKACLAEKTCLKADQVLSEVCNNKNGFTFNPTHWDFPTPLKFIQYCIAQFDEEEDIRIYKQVELCPVSKEPFPADYIMINSDMLVVEQEDYLKLQPLAMDALGELRRSRLPSPPFSEGETIDAYSNHIKRHETIRMEHHRLVDTNEMFGIDRALLQKRHEFQMKLQSDPHVEFALETTSTPNPSKIKLHMYMLAHLRWDQSARLWYRVRVCRILPGYSNIYEVYGIDYGFEKLVPLANLRHLPNVPGIANVMAFAVPIELDAEQHPSSGKKKWGYGLTFDDLSLHKLIGYENIMLGMEFIKSARSESYGCLRWTVCRSMVGSVPPKMVSPCLNPALKDAKKKVDQ